MRKLILATMLLALSGLSPALARGGMHGIGMNGGGMHSAMGFGLANPANPSVPPSLTPDARLTGNAPLPPHQQPTSPTVGTVSNNLYLPTPDEAALDKKIGSICKGC